MLTHISMSYSKYLIQNKNTEGTVRLKTNFPKQIVQNVVPHEIK